ncbi:glycosyltransferase family 48 protein [Phanerochaete carnosa HHB-10118-sp]|uniref:1,3-beta-glucan synthase n=1 Tax=Phanerochaete carnosa (strain HHB-10118-sp) TaxID=650164 RepID=K5W0B8_PHACS|nr:glycosyltransferase family 48 protein [Phanerochaete carnosa HHB-10118-sp]EKM57278.1 glycosyltransferase family 48 protein [Phanerochaete carnosa HHB-10118-sp]
MAARSGSRSREGIYASPPPSSDPHDPFSNSQAADPRYYDNDSEHDYGRGNRDTYGSDSSNVVDEDRYYDQSGPYDPYGPQPDTDSDVDVYGQKYTPSSESLPPPRVGISEASTPTFLDSAPGHREPYPAWSSERQIPLSKEEIEDIFLDLTQKFGFQRDSMRNMFDFTMQLLDSRASRMSPNQALLTLHADYIGGQHANYRKWYFAAQLDLDDAVGQSQNPGLQRLKSVKRGKGKVSTEKSLNNALERWRQAMNNMSQYDRMRQIALWLLCWGEAAQVRFVPECLCFIFKCADDYYRSPDCQNRMDSVPEGLYLHSVVKPLYRFIRDQGYEVVAGKFVRRERDHDSIIGYDDVNQLFWYPEGIARIVLFDKTRLVDLAPAQRFMKFSQIDWNRVFFKTYYEKRSFGHLLVNFNRIWVIHIAMYWFYTAYNSPTVYNGFSSVPLRWSATALGGAIATIIMIAATLAEFSYIPTTWNNTSHLTRRLLFLIVTLALTAGPTFYVAIAENNSPGGQLALILGIVQFFISAVATLLFATLPSGRMFGDRVAGKSRKYLASQTFTASYPSLHPTARIASLLLWLLVFGCKFTESYFFLTQGFRNPIRVMVGMKIQNCNDRFFGNALCRNQAAFTLTIMYIMDLVLFFLDTFLWWIIWNTVFSIARSFMLGLSIWTPWKDIYIRLPKRIYSKLLATADLEMKYKPKVLVSQIWNAVIISMYREHLLSIDHVQKLLYHQVDSGQDGRRSLRAPAFFISQSDKGFKGEFFTPGSEAERRISFFAQSLTTAIPEPLPVDAMPTFTVLTPHYSEKILLSLREIIREEDQNTRVTLLEYLKQLHPVEWDNFVKDTKILAEESEDYNGPNPFGSDEKGQSKADDLPFYCIGFKSAAPEFTLRTRIWASLRAQTLYRTVSGMMNYGKAIKLLYRVENPEVVRLFGGNTDKLERELERMARRKFKFVVSMQRYAKFSREEQENAEFLLRAYPDLQIAYLEEEPAPKEGGDPRLFSALIDGHCEFISDNPPRRRPKFRIELPGNPILGDGKSDNQNHAIIFYRGEYLQLIDANQDNYLEECLKIRNVLGEFEEYATSNQSPYAQWGRKEFKKSPVAIVGAREYIFSENIGILGDLAAGKEQTFGTLAARSLAWIGGKLHYGHPDFLNALYMTTRGGVSKAQKGLHLNEDIYAGMNAFGRGGRIKHTEYYQCGKGRDLGFGTILNFQTKIGTGMGEQMLSREYYYLGTQLPIDRFLTFYYGHPGFHINNMLVILSVQVFVLTMVFLGTLNSQVAICKYTKSGQFLGPKGCYNLTPVFQWIDRCIISIFLVFMIAFLPLFLQELVERGTIKAIKRLVKHFGSASPAFEVFCTQILSHSIATNLTFGGARYIATGRGFAVTRISFSILYSRFAGPSIYLGMRILLMLLYVTLTLWSGWVTYFWISVLALCISPFLFNPHQFSFSDFIIDYREFLRWMNRGNSRAHQNSWIGYCRLSRTMITGYKKKRLGHPSEKLSGDVPRAGWRAVIFSEVVFPIVMAILLVVCYMFVKSFPDSDGRQPASPLIRIAVVSFGPIVFNAAVLLVQFMFSLFLGPFLDTKYPKFGSVMAFISHSLGVIGLIGFFEFLWFLELWNVSHAVLGLICVVFIQRAVQKVLISVFLSREFKHDETNRAWWTGKWYGRGLGTYAMSQPAREFVVKIIELSLWSSDFLTCHLLLFLLTPPILIPYIDRLHSMLLFWLRPSKQIRAPLYSIKQKRQRRMIVIKYGLMYILSIIIFAALIAIPLAFRQVLHFNCVICQNI